MDQDKKPKKPRIRKSPETVRERADKSASKKLSRSKGLKGKIYRPLKALKRTGAKEYNPVSVPDGKAGKVLNKRFHLMPKYIREAWAELKLVTWPTKKEAAKLTGAVVIFAIIFAVFVQIIDLIFNKLFKIILT
jgi:preprotein translocase subunit SecE